MIVAETEELCLQHTKFALDILSKAGFFIHYDKSVLQPVHWGSSNSSSKVNKCKYIYLRRKLISLRTAHTTFDMLSLLL